MPFDRNEDIEFLDRFRKLVDLYLFLGYAPPEDPLSHEYDAEDTRRMHEALQKREFQTLRRSINEMMPRVKRLFSECNVTPWLQHLPPPAIGGAVVRFNVLDLIFENTAESKVPKTVIFDSIDQAVGILKEGPSKIQARKKAEQPYVFVSHSSKDSDIVSAVKQGFADLPLNPYFAEDKPTGVSPSKEIAEAVTASEALFLFFTFNSMSGETRDWIVFEIGTAVAQGKRIFSWKQRGLTKEQLPRMLEQVSTYRECDISVRGIMNLAQEIREAAKKLC
jgi:hypothetical protein